MNESATELIKRSRKGDKNAFGELVMLYGDYVFSLVFRMVTIEAIAEDITQEVFIKAWCNINKYKEKKSKFTTWLYTIASRLSLDYLRSNKRMDAVDESMGLCYDIEEWQDNVELGKLIRQACDHLSETQKVVFVLRDLQDIEVNEVVSITGFSEKKIKDNLYVARKKVRKKLDYYLKI